MLRALIRSAMIALYPRTEALPGIEDCDLDAFLVRLQRESSFLVWLGISAGSVAYHLAPLVTVGVPLPAGWLPARTRARYIEKVTAHPIYHLRQLIFLVKFGAGLCWGAHPKVREALALPAYPADPGTWRSA